MTMSFHKKSSSRAASAYMKLKNGDKVVVIGGANSSKIGYIVGETSCHYKIVFVDGSNGDVWRQNVRVLDGNDSIFTPNITPTQVTAASGSDSEVELANEKAELERKLNRALVQLRDLSNEIDDYFKKMTGIKIRHSIPFPDMKRHGGRK